MPRKRITLAVLVALGALFVGVPAATAVPPEIPPWEHDFPVYAPGGKTGWRAVWHKQGGAVSSHPRGATLGARTIGGSMTGVVWRLSEPYVDETAIRVQVEFEHQICLGSCGYPAGTPVEQQARSVQVTLVGVECYDIATRTTREVFTGGGIQNEGGNGYSHSGIGPVRSGYEYTDPRTVITLTLNETGSPSRCSATERTTSVFLRVKYVHPSTPGDVDNMTVFQYRVDGWRQDVDDRPSLEECVLWFGEFYGPDWPERYDGKTPAEVGCDRWNRDQDGDDFGSWCRDAPEASFFVLKTEAPFFGLEIGWIPSWIGHYAECLFNPRDGFDTTPIGEAAEEGWMGASRNILASVTGAFGGSGGGTGAFHASNVGGQGEAITWADDDHARALLGDDFVDGLNTGAVPVSPAGFGPASSPGCGKFVEELPVIGDGVSSCALGNAWPDSWRTAAGAVVMIMASFATLFGILRFMGVRYGWSTG